MRSLIHDLMNEEKLTKRRVETIKRQWVRGKSLDKIPLNSEILAKCNSKERNKLKPILTTKPMRTASGVSVVAIMPKPMGCPANCTYCPTAKNAPKSYTGFEPSTMRAIRNNFDPYKTVKNRLKQLQTIGHNTDKNELIIMGGTFPAADWDYQKEFVKSAFDGFNSTTSKNLAEAQKKNETAKNRVVGLTLETRPDHIFPERFLELGATRVEMGLQSAYDDVLKAVNRGHTVNDIKVAIKELKEDGFKVLLHMMPGLPSSNYERDLNMFKEIFENSDFCPDMLKIYPTLVIKNTKLCKQWQSGDYKPISSEYMLKLLENVLKICPKWVRIMRVQRDIPATQIMAGPKISNLREVADKNLDKENFLCKEIRFREAGHKYQRTKKVANKIEVLTEKYNASDGTEYFISAEDKDQDILLGFCRLRLGERKEAMIRELHVYGHVTPIGVDGKETQHTGLGTKLLKKAEEIAKKSGRKEMLVISGVGVREYYRKVHSYKLKGNYMWKAL